MSDHLDKTIRSRKHPDYADNLDHWDFLEATYRGGRGWFEKNIFKYHKEGKDEYANRVARAYRFNHPKEIVELVNKYIFKADISRKDDAPEFLKRFWSKTSRRKWSIEEAMPVYSKWASVFGRIWVVVDTTKPSEGVSLSGVFSVEDLKKSGYRVYTYFIKPQDFLDCGYDDEGELIWALVRETYRDERDPLSLNGGLRTRYRLWERNQWTVYEPNDKEVLIQTKSGVTNLGCVPIIPLDDITSSEDYTSSSLIEDIAYLDRAVANYLSNLDAIIQDQTFSQLAMPAQAALLTSNSEEDVTSRNQILEVGKKRVFLYDGEGGAAPFFLSPDPKQAELIITAIRQIINEIYHSVGVAGERTKQDNSSGIDNSSGVAKAYDFERVNSLLANKGKSLERFENKLCEMVAKWVGDSKAVAYLNAGEKYVKYPKSYDTRDFGDELNISQRLEEITTPLLMKQHQLKRSVTKMYPFIDDKTKKELFLAIDEMKDAMDVMMGEKDPDSDPFNKARPNEQNQEKR